MATHFICQATEPLPHRFPTSRAPEKGHGAVSQYELLNLSDKSHCQFPPPGWDTSESSEDSLPLYRAPVPSWKTSSNLIGPDPDLCITPEKSLANKIFTESSRNISKTMLEEAKGKILKDPELDLTLTPEKVVQTPIRDHKSNLRHGAFEDTKSKNQHRVRFELENSKVSTDSGEESLSIPRLGPAKPYTPLSYTDDKELKTDQKTSQYTINTINNRTVYVPVNSTGKAKDIKLANHFDNEFKIPDDTSNKENIISVLPESVNQEKTDPSIICHVKNNKTSQGKKSKCEKPDVSSQKERVYIKGDSGPKRKVKVKRETAEHQELSGYNCPINNGIPDTLEYEHVFNRPEYNSTLRMRTELQQIKDSQVDVAKALEKKLQISDSKKTEIVEKATSKVNTKDTMYTGLVSLEIPLDDLCNQVELSKSTKTSSKSSRPQQVKHSNEPDLMEFFTPGLQKEQAELTFPGLPSPSESLSLGSHIRAFDLYRHNRVWDNNSYFSVKKK